MTSINPFSTPLANGQPPVAGGTGTGVFGAGTAGVTFWDFLLGGTPGTPGAPSLPGQTTPQQSSLLTLTAKTKIAPDANTMTQPGGDTDIILDALETGDPQTLTDLALFLDSAEQNQNADLGADLRIERIQKRIDTLDKLVNHLTNGLPATQQNDVMIDTLVARLDQQIEKLQVRLKDLQEGNPLADDSSAEMLIALGLTPAQLTKMSQRIDEVEKKLGRELTVEDLIAGVANIIPLPEDKNKMLLPVSTKAPLDIKPEDVMNLPEDTELTDDLAAQLNGLVVGVGSNGNDLTLTGSGDDGAGTDKPVMRGLDLLQKLMTGAKEAAATGSTKAADLAKSGFSSLLNLAGVDGDIALPSGWYQSFTSGIDFSSFDIQAGLPLTSAAQAAHITTSVQQAGHAHPATHIVSAHLTKAAQDGGPQTMTIQLDPPELGRVDVRLEFGSDNSVKAHLIVEKAETLGMLQRDAAFLDRALTNAGLDTANGSALSFELAQDRAFDHGGRDNNNGSGNGDGKRADTDEDIIQSTMTWQVDPDSGHVRYNILA